MKSCKRNFYPLLVLYSRRPTSACIVQYFNVLKIKKFRNTIGALREKPWAVRTIHEKRETIMAGPHKPLFEVRYKGKTYKHSPTPGSNGNSWLRVLTFFADIIQNPISMLFYFSDYLRDLKFS